MKKVLVWLLLSVGVIVLVVVCIGAFSGPRVCTNVIEVKADQQSTWNVFQNPARMKQWIEGFKRIEMLEGSIGQVGSTYRLLFVQNGEENELFQEITEIEAPVIFSYSMHNDFLVGSSTTTMTEENGITTITSMTQYKGQNIFLNAMFVFMNSSLQKSYQSNFERLKELVETSQ